MHAINLLVKVSQQQITLVTLLQFLLVKNKNCCHLPLYLLRKYLPCCSTLFVSVQSNNLGSMYLMDGTSHFQNHSSSCGQDVSIIFVPHSILCIHLSYLSVLERWFKPKINDHSSISHLIYKSALYYSHRM